MVNKMMQDAAVLAVKPLGFVWETSDPFLFCVHHDDKYPAGNEKLGPQASLSGRNIGQDFDGKDGWSMYHGTEVPGFPQHPHRGFETITLVRRGYIDHSDSMGATARFGLGDVQWMTAGKGVVHAEMFPLIQKKDPNPVELFQIWLNLPRVDKMVEPHFTMLWNQNIPSVVATDDKGNPTEIRVVAGALAGKKGPKSPPKSWAAREEANVAIFTIRMAPNAKWTLPKTAAGTNRMLFFFKGKSIHIGHQPLDSHVSAKLKPEVDVVLVNGPEESELLLLQGQPIGEPVVQHGPFVMNSPAEIRQAFLDYQATEFGGWPWKRADPVHAASEGRFAKHADGKIEHG